MTSNELKNNLLGMPFGTAQNRLKKVILFTLIKEVKKDICFRCKKIIANVEELSIEHKENWQSAKNPIYVFFDINNIAFSHLSCNVSHSSGSKLQEKHKYCINNHLLDNKNVYISDWLGKKRRQCRTCHKEQMRKSRNTMNTTL